MPAHPEDRMPLIEYRGHTPVVSVPTFQLADVERGVPTEVPADVAEALVGDGTGPWVLVGGDQGDDETPED